MNYVPQISRRAFVVSAAAFGGGLALGVDLPFGANVVRAADGSPEVTAWVVIKPDDGVIIRVARSEMGQGSMTGLAQLVAEELECDWSKVSTEFPTPGENLARTASGAVSSPPEAELSANRMNTCARPARPRARC
jgi:isoquinoline 1-oxidoreductase subunit beta